MCQIDFFSIPDHMEVSEFTELTVTLFPNCVLFMCSRNLALLSRAARSSAIGARGTTDLGQEFYPRLGPPRGGRHC